MTPRPAGLADRAAKVLTQRWIDTAPDWPCMDRLSRAVHASDV